MGKTKKDTNARVAGRRKEIKEIKEREAKQLYMDNISTGLDDRVERFVDIEFIGFSVNIPVIAFKFPNFYRTVLFSYLDFFPPYSSACRTFASSLIDVFSFLLSCFRFFKLGHVFNLSMFTYNLIELHLIPKMLSSQNNNADQLCSQFMTFVQVIPANIVSVDCICSIGLSIKT